MKKLLLTTALLIPSLAQAEIIMKAGFLTPIQSPRGQGAELMAQKIHDSANCDIAVQLYPSSQLGGTTDLIEGMQIGSVEMSILPAAFMVGFQPLVGILDFPFYFPTDKETLLAFYDSAAMRTLLDTTEEKGVKSLAMWHTGYKTWTANKPVVTLADYKGLAARVMPSEIIKEQDRLLGMQAVDMPFSETYTALANGAIDTQENPIDTNFFMKFHEVQDYVTLSYHGTLDQIVSVSSIFWSQLSPECQADVQAAVDAGGRLTAEKTDAVIANLALPAFKASGTEVVEVPDTARAEIAAALLPEIKAYYVKQNGEAGQTVLDAFDAEIAK